MDVSKVFIPDHQKIYCQRLEDKLVDVDPDSFSDVDALCNYLKEAIFRSGLDTFGSRKRQDTELFRESSDTLEPILKNKREALLRLKLRQTEKPLADYRAARALAHKCVNNYC